MICVTWLLLINAIYSGGGCVKFEYVSFPIGWVYVHCPMCETSLV